MNPKTERNKEIIIMIREGCKYKTIGAKYGITKARVHQLALWKAHKSGYMTVREWRQSW